MRDSFEDALGACVILIVTFAVIGWVKLGLAKHSPPEIKQYNNILQIPDDSPIRFIQIAGYTYKIKEDGYLVCIDTPIGNEKWIPAIDSLEGGPGFGVDLENTK